MVKSLQLVLPTLLLCVVAAAAQNSTQQATPATQAATPRGTQTQTPAGTPAPPGAGAPGITGVQRYRAGFRGPRGTTAPKATAKVTTLGDANGDGKLDTAASAALPGVEQFRNNSLGLKAGTPIVVKLQQSIDSGTAHNGDTVRGTLAAPLGSLGAGTPVKLTVVASAAAGQMTSVGELSLQVLSVNGSTVLSQVITAEGKEGERLTPDGAPTRGTEAVFNAGEPISLPAA